MSDCVFCRIAAGEIPAAKLYEDDHVVAFNDLSPQAPVHFLVIPKAHIPGAGDITPGNSDLVARCFETIAALAAEDELKGGFRVITNCGGDAGQTVDHLHFHVLSGGPLGARLLAE